MALDPIADLTGVGIEEADGKTWFTNMRAYLAGLLGTDGVPATARAALDVGAIGEIPQNIQSANYTTVASDKGQRNFSPLVG